MLLTEDDIGAQVGLPGPIVAELLLQGGRLDNAIASSTPQFCDTDVMRAQVAAMMLSAGVRWPYVHVAMTRDPRSVEEWQWCVDFWAAILPTLVALPAPAPLPARRACAPRGVLITLVALALMLGGVVVGLYLLPWGSA